MRLAELYRNTIEEFKKKLYDNKMDSALGRVNNKLNQLKIDSGKLVNKRSSSDVLNIDDKSKKKTTGKKSARRSNSKHKSHTKGGVIDAAASSGGSQKSRRSRSPRSARASQR